jgi:hypothetical protein
MKRTAKINVCVLGAAFDINNRGVSALSSSLVRLITDAVPKRKQRLVNEDEARFYSNLLLSRLLGRNK